MDTQLTKHRQRVKVWDKCRVLALGCGVSGLGFWVKGLGSRVLLGFGMSSF